MFSSPVVEANRELADRISKEIRETPAHPYAAKFVGLANGKVVAVADSLNEIGELLERIEPDNTRTFVLEVGADYSKVEYIWEAR